MKEMTDAELMTPFTQGESEEAFITLVNRHIHARTNPCLNWAKPRGSSTAPRGNG